MRLVGHNYKSNQRVEQRRSGNDRRAVVRFGDALGRRSGLERREIPVLKRFSDSLMVFLRGKV